MERQACLRLQSGGDIGARASHREALPAVVLAAERISKDFSAVRVLCEVDFSLRRGEIHALVGENGAGKSTFVKILSGVHIEHEGSIRIDDKDVRFASVRDAELAGIAMIHQELNLVPE